MPISRAVVLTIDRLGAGWIGPYGNTWLETPNFNRLAAESLLVETAIAESPSLEKWCRSVWCGLHAMATVPGGESLAERAALAGGISLLVTDDRQVADFPLAATFGERRLLDVAPATMMAQQVENTGLFRFFAAAQEAVQEFDGGGLLWLHSRGMAAAWDAPPEFRNQFADELDPDPPALVAPPDFLLAANHDPDELLGMVQAYAGQVALADLCLGPLLQALDSHPLAHETLLVVTSPRGYPLGEHRAVGPGEAALYGELLHVPLLIRLPESEAARLQRIVQPHQLSPLISEVCGLSPLPDSTPAAAVDRLLESSDQDVACSQNGAEQAIRTAAWFMRRFERDGVTGHELFAKPDDRWEANEVSSRCAEVVELLAAEFDRCTRQSLGGETPSKTTLAPALCDFWR